MLTNGVGALRSCLLPLFRPLPPYHLQASLTVTLNRRSGGMRRPCCHAGPQHDLDASFVLSEAAGLVVEFLVLEVKTSTLSHGLRGSCFRREILFDDTSTQTLHKLMCLTPSPFPYRTIGQNMQVSPADILDRQGPSLM